jgi:dihydroxy-acid dehydratase
MTVTGQTLGEILDSSPFRVFPLSRQIIRPLSEPLYPSSSLIVLYGNIAPDGAVMKASASKNRNLLTHKGPAVVFANSTDLAKRIDDPELEVSADSILILQNTGPIGNPGMPEAGLLPIPRKLAAAGVKDMLRISDGRMSGTAGGTIILHVSPESAVPESPFGIVQTGDIITCDVNSRKLQLELPDEDLKARIEARKSAVGKEAKPKLRGYRGLYERTVNQAQDGADFDFLTADGGWRD